MFFLDYQFCLSAVSRAFCPFGGVEYKSMKIFSKKFAGLEKLPTFAIPKGNNAEIAQLVERNLAKVKVAGPSPVFRSKR